MSAEAQKRAAAERACDFVAGGMRVGLGTGSTAAFFVEALGRRVRAGLDIRCVATSEATARQAATSGLTVVTLEDEPELDLAIDGADEIGPDLALVKGGGAALLREKLVAAASRRMIVIADESKRVAKLGRFPLPVEIVAFGAATTVRRIGDVLARSGLPREATIRRTPAGALLTDGGNLIVDLRLGVIPDPAALARDLKALLGVVEHGLFVGMASLALIGTASGVIEIGDTEPARRLEA